SAAQFIHLALEDKRARGGKLVNEVVVAELEPDRLPANRWPGLEVVNDLEPVNWPRQGGERRVAGADLNRFRDHQRLERCILLDHAGIFDRIDERLAGPV